MTDAAPPDERMRYATLRQQGYSQEDAMRMAESPNTHGQIKPAGRYANRATEPEPLSFERVYELVKQDGYERKLYAQLREKGAPPEQALALAEKQTRNYVQGIIDVGAGKREGDAENIGMPQSTAANINKIDGFTFGFGDEIAGAVDAAGAAIEGKPMLPAYRKKRDEVRAIKEEAIKVDKSKTRIPLIDVDVNHNQLIGGLPLAALAPVKGAVGAIRAGAALGGIGAAGHSDADLTKGEVGKFAGDTATGAAVGAGLGLATHGVMSGAGAAGRYAIDKVMAAAGRRPMSQSIARNMASKVADEIADEAPANMGNDRTMADTVRKGRAIEKHVNETIPGELRPGEKFTLSPAALTGSRELALAQRVAESTSGMNHAQSLNARRFMLSEKYLDKLADDIAANPADLGTSRVSKAATDATETAIESMRWARTAEAAPDYAIYEKAHGGVNYSGIRAAIVEEMNRNGLKLDQLSKKLQDVLNKADKAGAGGGLSLIEANSIRKLMNETASGKATAFGNNTNISAASVAAMRVRDAVDQAFIDAEATAISRGRAEVAGGTVEGIQALKRANAAWAKHSQKLEGHTTKTVQKFLDAAGTDSTQTLTDRIFSLKTDQITALVEVIEAGDPKVAMNVLRDMRGQALLTAYEEGGKLPRGATYSREIGINQMPAKRIMDGLGTREPQLRALYGNDKRAIANFMRAQDLLQRQSFGPNVHGSDTMPKAWMAGRMAEMGRRALAVAGKITGDTQAALDAFNTANGIAAFNQALEIMIADHMGKPISTTAARALAQSVRIAGIDSALDLSDAVSEILATDDQQKKTKAVADTNTGTGP